jgi:predicted O-methyltransferase YrrM
MSAKNTLVGAEHFAYIASHTRGEDAFLRDLKRAAVAAGIPQIWISPEQASFMQILLKLISARQVIEVGTLAGYSAIVMARALPQGGRVRTIELDPRHVAFAREWAAKSDVAERVEVIEGAGNDALTQFDADSADAVFLDADKANYAAYLQHCMRIVRRGGLIMADNAFAFGQLFDQNPTDREAPAMKAFNEYMTGVAGLHGVIVPWGDGCWVAVKE